MPHMHNHANPTIRLKIERRSQHPWVFQKMVDRPEPKPKPGSIVEVVDKDGQWVGRGFYNGRSRITLRMLTADPDERIDREYFRRRIQRAVSLRRDILKLDLQTTAYRLIHSEGDDLSGLVVDRFGDLLVIEFFAAGMWKQRTLIQECLAEHFPDATVYWFAEEHIGKQESFDCPSPPLPPGGLIQEHGLSFRFAPGLKHKTGFFTDQRDNRHRLAQVCGGAKVLDLCCNSGGFAIYAKALGGAAEVIGIDLDETVLELANENARLNKAAVRFVQADIFHWLREAAQRPQRFDVVVLDPAKMTRDRDQVLPALKKYLDMNKLAMQVVEPGGLLFSCSCTGLVSEEQFLDMLRRAAYYAGRTVQILEVRGAGADHPYLAHVPESRYLKAVLCRVW